LETSVTPSVYKCPKQTSTEQIKMSVKIIHLRVKQAAIPSADTRADHVQEESQDQNQTQGLP